MIGRVVAGKVAVYIDAANIIFSARNLDFDLDMLRLIQHLKDSLRPERIVYFTGKFQEHARRIRDDRACGH